MTRDLFIQILQMSLIGCYSIGVALLARPLLARCGRRYAYYLWLIVFLNLCMPVSLNGIFSLIPRQVAEFSLEPPSDRVREEVLPSLPLQPGEQEQVSKLSEEVADQKVPVAVDKGSAVRQQTDHVQGQYREHLPYIWLLGVVLLLVRLMSTKRRQEARLWTEKDLLPGRKLESARGSEYPRTIRDVSV